MALRGKKPVEGVKRLRAMMYGPAGVGKTMAAIQMPRPYIIDTENGTQHYGDTIEKSGGAVFATTSVDEVIAEVATLMTEAHEYRSLIIDPFTPLYDEKLDEGEKAVGSDFGRHYGYAAKVFKRLFNMLTMIDMNVIVTCHAKKLYGDGMKVIGETFDGWKKLDYIFDLVFELSKAGQGTACQRRARVVKTRLEQFPDGSSFIWSYDALAERYGGDLMERAAEAIVFVTADQVAEIRRLLEVVKMGDDWLDKCMTKANVDDLTELTGEQAQKMIDAMTKKLQSTKEVA